MEPMTTRQRLLAALNFEPCDHPPYWEWAYWPEALDRWYTEGLERRAGYPPTMGKSEALNGDAGDWRPGMPREKDAHDFLGLDEGFVHPPVWGRIMLPQPVRVVAEDEHSRTYYDDDGILKRNLKDGMSMPDFLEHPIQNRKDWEAVKAGLDCSLSKRITANWDQFLSQVQVERTFPVSLLGYPEGLFGQLRDMLGAKDLLTTFYDDPAMIHDILDTLADLWLALWEEMLALFQPDSVTFWEDMCYKAGPLISPKMFREFLLPRYQRLTAYGRAHGIRHFLVDSDGDMRKLIPLWIEGGITCVYPFEVQAGMNVDEIGAQYPDLGLMGGIDKREVVKGPEAIDAELERRMPFLLQRGGFVPTLDHHVTSEVSWDNYVYYRRKVAEYCEKYSPTVSRRK